MINGVINGSEYLLLLDDQYIMFGSSANMQVNVATKDISCRETNNWHKKVLASRDWAMDFEGKLGYKYNNGTTASVHSGIVEMSYKDLINFQFMEQAKVEVKLMIKLDDFL